MKKFDSVKFKELFKNYQAENGCSGKKIEFIPFNDLAVLTDKLLNFLANGEEVSDDQCFGVSLSISGFLISRGYEPVENGYRYRL